MASDPMDAVTPKELGPLLDSTLERLARRALGQERPVPLPWSNVSDALGGGLWGGTLVSLLGDLGTGKTQWALQAALFAAEAGVPVCYVGLEYGEDQVAARLFALKAGKRWSDLYVGRDGETDLEELRRTHASALRALPFHVVGGTSGRWSYTNLRALGAWMRARYPEERRGARPLVLMVDYLQLVGGTARDEDERDVMERAVQEAVGVARDLDLVVLLISSTVRESDQRMQVDESIGFGRDRRRHPILGRGNPAKLVRGKHPLEIEQRSDCVLVLALEPRSQGDWTRAWCAVAKNRSGARAWCALKFDGRRFDVDSDAERRAEAARRDAAEQPEAAAADES